MGEVFFGPWTVLVERIAGNVHHHLRIHGSDTSDGEHLATARTLIPVTGDRWEIDMATATHEFGTVEGIVRRSSGYSVSRGLAVRLSVVIVMSIPFPMRVIEIRSELLVVVQNDDPALNPDRPNKPPFDFSLPDDVTVIDSSNR